MYQQSAAATPEAPEVESMAACRRHQQGPTRAGYACNRRAHVSRYQQSIVEMAAKGKARRKRHRPCKQVHDTATAGGNRIRCDVMCCAVLCCAAQVSSPVLSYAMLSCRGRNGGRNRRQGSSEAALTSLEYYLLLIIMSDMVDGERCRLRRPRRAYRHVSMWLGSLVSVYQPGRGV